MFCITSDYQQSPNRRSSFCRKVRGASSFLLSAACSAFSIAAVLMTNCTEAIAGMLIDEFTNKDGHDPEQAVEYISHILKSSLPGVLTSASQK